MDNLLGNTLTAWFTPVGKDNGLNNSRQKKLALNGTVWKLFIESYATHGALENRHYMTVIMVIVIMIMIMIMMIFIIMIMMMMI